MKVILTPLWELEPGNIFITSVNNIGDNTYRVIRNAGDCILLERLIPIHEFLWWKVDDVGNINVEVIKNKE